MNILIVDRDFQAAEALKNLLVSQGHNVVHETVRKSAQERLKNEHIDMVFIDPAPLASVREFSMPLRWEHREDYLYLVLTGHDTENVEAIRNGMNAKLAKPYHPLVLNKVLEDGQKLIELMNRLHTEKNSMTDNRIFGQRALYQLLLSALDRAYRYHEQAFLLVIRIANMDKLAVQAGSEVAAQVMDELGKYLSKLHRLSDFLGHTGRDEYMLLILRPGADSEPQDAIERFDTALRDFQDRITLRLKPELRLELWALPSAEMLMYKDLTP